MSDDDALEAAERAVLRSGSGAAEWSALIRLRLAAGDARTALAEAHDALRRHPTNGAIWLQLATSLERTARPQAALAAAEVGLALQDPTRNPPADPGSLLDEVMRIER